MSEFGKGGFGWGGGGVRLWHYDADYRGSGKRRSRKIWGIWRRWTMWEKQAASGWSSVRYWDYLPIFLAPVLFSPLSCGVSQKSTMQLQVMGGYAHNCHQSWIQLLESKFMLFIMEQAQSWEGGGIRDSHVLRCNWDFSMHHSYLGKLCQPCNRSVNQKWNTRTSGTVDQRWSWMTLCCSKSYWPLSHSIFRWSYRPWSNTLLTSSYVSAYS